MQRTSRRVRRIQCLGAVHATSWRRPQKPAHNTRCCFSLVKRFCYFTTGLKDRSAIYSDGPSQAFEAHVAEHWEEGFVTFKDRKIDVGVDAVAAATARRYHQRRIAFTLRNIQAAALCGLCSILYIQKPLNFLTVGEVVSCCVMF